MTDSKNADIKKLREQIDRIDTELLRLYEERMDVCKEIGEYKKSKGIAAYDPERETEKLDSVFAAVKNKEYADGAAQMFIALMQASVEMQEGLWGDETDGYDMEWSGDPIEFDLKWNPDELDDVDGYDELDVEQLEDLDSYDDMN